MDSALRRPDHARPVTQPGTSSDRRSRLAARLPFAGHPEVTPAILSQAAHQLTGSLRAGTASETAYDTAVVARLRSRSDIGSLAFPTATMWLRRNQHADGAWGGRIELPHDRVACTLAAIVHLAEMSESWAQEAVQAGLTYLWRHGSEWRTSPHETVGFELLVPRMLDEARRLNLALPYDLFASIVPLRDEKLRRLPPRDRLFAQPTTLLHSLETLGSDFDPLQVQALRGRNGSYGNSPSSTAHVLAYLADEAASAYLHDVLSVSVNGGAPTVFPFEVFERAWVLYNLGYAGYSDEHVRANLAYLLDALGPGGVAISREGLVPDCDDTAMTMIVLERAGFPTDLATLTHFESDRFFTCFPHERNTSVTANARALEAFKVGGGQLETRWRPQIAKLTDYLRAQRRTGGYWQDKWHASPFYATAHVALAAHGIANELLADTTSWLLANQHADGSWGQFGGTSEETAYAIQALWTIAPHGQRAVRQALGRGAAVLAEQLSDTDYPELWIGKGLYTPYAVVRSAVISALMLCCQDGFYGAAGAS